MWRFRRGLGTRAADKTGVPGAGKKLAWQVTGYAWGRCCDSGRLWAWYGPGTKGEASLQVALGHLKALTRGPR